MQRRRRRDGDGVDVGVGERFLESQARGRRAWR